MVPAPHPVPPCEILSGRIDFPGHLPSPFQFIKFQVSNIVFQIIGRTSNDQFVDTLYCIWIIDPVIAEKADCISYRPAVIMNSHVCKRIKSKNDRTVFLEKGCFSLRERCKVVGHHFRIGGPALNVSAKIKNAPDRIRLRSRKIDGLVQMSGIAFVSKGCVEIQP